jgi:NitT/TauT family transport system substrate-binding protein
MAERAALRRLTGLFLALGVAALLVGMWAASSSAKQAGKYKTLTTVTVGVDPLWLSAPPYVCEAYGICKQYGLNIQPVSVSSTAAMVAAIQSGSMDFGVGSLAAEFQAYAEGLPVSMLAPNGGETEKLGAAAVAANSPITSLSQLAGKPYCEQTIGGQAQAQVQFMLQQGGVNPTSIKFIGIPYPDMVQALQSGECASADLEAPFLNAALAAKQVRVIGNEDLIFGPSGSPATAYFTFSTYTQAHPTIVKNFVAAMMATHRYIAKHPQALQTVEPEFLGVTPAQAKTTPVGVFPTSFKEALLQQVANRMVAYHLVIHPVKVSAILYPGAPVSK